MAMISSNYHIEVLNKRDMMTSNNTGYGYIGFVALLALFMFFSICVTNSRRRRKGQTPYISQYLAPPTYIESQFRSHANNPQEPQDLPIYTQNVNPDQDAGYYDMNGNFIATNKQRAPVYDGYNTDVREAHIQGEGSSTADMYRNDGHYQQQENNQTIYSRPDGPPPNQQSASTTLTTTRPKTESYTVPEPPAFEEVVGTSSNNPQESHRVPPDESS